MESLKAGLRGTWFTEEGQWSSFGKYHFGTALTYGTPTYLKEKYNTKSGNIHVSEEINKL